MPNLQIINHCVRCPSLGEDHVLPQGNTSLAEIMVVGLAPGKNDIETGEPFTGPNGEVFNFFLEEAGLSREQVYLTNLVKCHPPGNRKPIPEEITECMKTWLKREVMRVSPKIIILVGKEVWQAITKEKFEYGHGVVSKTPKRTYFCIYSPGYFLRRGSVDKFVEAAHKLREIYEES